MKTVHVLGLLLLATSVAVLAQAAAPVATTPAPPTPPTRPADGPGAPHWTVMPDRASAPPGRNGDFEYPHSTSGNGGGDAQGSERGLEYDTLSGKYAEFIEHEVLLQVESRYHLELTNDPHGRAATAGRTVPQGPSEPAVEGRYRDKFCIDR